MGPKRKTTRKCTLDMPNEKNNKKMDPGRAQRDKQQENGPWTFSPPKKKQQENGAWTCPMKKTRKWTLEVPKGTNNKKMEHGRAKREKQEENGPWTFPKRKTTRKCTLDMPN